MYTHTTLPTKKFSDSPILIHKGSGTDPPTFYKKTFIPTYANFQKNK